MKTNIRQSIDQNNKINNGILNYCHRVKKMTGCPPNEDELEGYIRFKIPHIKSVAMKAKIQVITKSKAYRRLR